MEQNRFVALSGAHNFRRVEGWRDAHGQRLRPGRLFRSSGLEALTAEDSETIASLSIAHVVDLRGESERVRHPSRWHEENRPEIWVGAECAAAAELGALLQSADAEPHAIAQRAKHVYAAFPEDLASAIRAALDAMSGPGEPNILIHCAAGKDRTGFVVATILRALGIREEDILEDYLLTNACFETACRVYSRRLPLAELEARAPGSLQALLGAHASYMAHADAAIAGGWGSFEAYLADAVGVTPDERRDLRQRYLQPA